MPAPSASSPRSARSCTGAATPSRSWPRATRDVPYEQIPTVDAKPVVVRLLGRHRGLHAAHDRGRVARGRTIRHRPLPHGDHTFVFAEHCETPVITTIHGRLDVAGMPELIAIHRDVPLVAISESQRRLFPDQRWVATIHHGLPLEAHAVHDRSRATTSCSSGRITAEKGIREAIELSRRSGIRLKVAAKVHLGARARALRGGRPAGDRRGRDRLPRRGRARASATRCSPGALATVMLGGWPEPFGLVAIESMATGTPVIARRAGALTETVDARRDRVHRRRRRRGRAGGREASPSWTGARSASARCGGSRRSGWPTSTRPPIAR